MSRLDDELKVAFRRKEPSMDFVARVLERINEVPAPKKNWWQTLARFFEPPKLRWVAIGVAASLLFVIATGGYRLLRHEPVEEGTEVASTDHQPETGGADTNKDESVVASVAPDKNAPKQITKKRDVAARSARNQARLAGLRKEPPVSREAEAAKERVLFALQIAGSTLSDAQKMIQEDSQKSKPEPLHNR
jgi:hypothetical protein